MRIASYSAASILAAFLTSMIGCGEANLQEPLDPEPVGENAEAVTDGRGFMIVSDTNPSLALNAYGGAAEGAFIKLASGCTRTNPDCTWTYGDGMLRSNRDPSLAINAWGGAANGTRLRLTRACTSTNPDCRWGYTKGAFWSATNMGLSMNAYGGAANLAEVVLVNSCPLDNPDCRWTMQRVMIRAGGQNFMVNAYGGARELGPIKLTSGCDSQNPDCTFTFRRGMLISDTNPNLAVNSYGGSGSGNELRLTSACAYTNPDCTYTWSAGALFPDGNWLGMVNSWGGQWEGTQLRINNACTLGNQDCLFVGQYGGDQCGRHGQAPCAGLLSYYCNEGQLIGNLCLLPTVCRDRPEGSSCQYTSTETGLCRSNVCQPFRPQFSMSLEDGNTTRPADPQLILSPFDNPLLQSTDTLQNVVFNGVNYAERTDATTSPNPWINYNFNLIASSSSTDPNADAKGARTVSSAYSDFMLIGEPAQRRWFNTGDVMPYLIHGVELGYAESTIQPIHQEINARPRALPAMRVQLDPQTILVPIQVIKVIPPTSSSVFSALNQITVTSLNELFDDKPRVDIVKVSHPNGEVFPNISLDRKANQLSFNRPDSIWAQCGVQFRAVSCGGFPDTPGKAQCPNLVVAPLNTGSCNIPADRRVRPSSNDCNCVETIARNNWDDAYRLPGVRSDLPIALLTWSVADPVCGGVNGSIAEVSLDGRLEMTLSDSAQGGAQFGLAHELGHLLGLTNSRHVEVPANVMAPFVSEQSNFVVQGHCATVRANAAIYAQRMWGASIDPNSWTITPPPSR